MFTIGKIKSRFVILSAALLIVILIGFFDYLSGEELSLSFFYLIPVSFVALYRGTTRTNVLIFTILSGTIWFVADIKSRSYSSFFFPAWNASMRLFLLIAFGLLLHYLKKKDKSLNTSNENLKTLNQEKNRIIGIAAHDLRNPISGINSLSDLLLDDYKNNTVNDHHEIIKMINSLSAESLIVLKNLLDVSKIESGRIDLCMELSDYVEFIRHRVIVNQILANKKGINIGVESDTPQRDVMFDRHYLAEAVDNLISNAIKYSPPGSTIVVKISEADNGRTLTEVIDRGKGIPEQEQNGLFSYFHTTSTRPTEGERSTGLGLAIVKKIVLLHNGEIGVKSVLNEGSDFYFFLPAKY